MQSGSATVYLKIIIKKEKYNVAEVKLPNSNSIEYEYLDRVVLLVPKEHGEVLVRSLSLKS